MKESERNRILEFFRQTDADGVTNETKAATLSHEICRLATTDKDKSYEEAKENQGSDQNRAQNRNGVQSEGEPSGQDTVTFPTGVVVVDDRIIGLGIHILNEDIYPLQSFRIYLRNCNLIGELDLSECRDMMFLDLYHNKVKKVITKEMPAMRIFGMQDNDLTELDVTGLPVCQGIDVGKNHLKQLDVSRNTELVELYINDNDFHEIDLTKNLKLKYFYCHNNQIEYLDVTGNPLLRHMDATGNPMKKIYALAPQREEKLPITLLSGEGGSVGLKFNPVYNAQWKETGEWQQSYYAYPAAGYEFDHWQTEDGECFSTKETVIDTYGESRVMTAIFTQLNK